jgi:hypothetical protein
MRTVLAFVIVAAWDPVAQACHSPAEDDADDEDDPPCKEPYARWSWLPEVSALAGYGADGKPHEVLGAELRVRYNSGRLEPRVYTFGLGAETFRRATVEPYLSIGFDELTQWCPLCADYVEMFGIAHVTAGAGLQWTDMHRGEPFVLARVTFGIAFARPAGRYITYDGEQGEIHPLRYRLSSQIDLVLETVVAADDWRFSIGFAIDPLRILPDLVAWIREPN